MRRLQSMGVRPSARRMSEKAIAKSNMAVKIAKKNTETIRALGIILESIRNAEITKPQKPKLRLNILGYIKEYRKYRHELNIYNIRESIESHITQSINSIKYESKNTKNTI